MEQAGVKQADYFLALTESDDQNLVAALCARRFGARATLALANAVEYVQLLERVGADVVVNPQLIAVGAILPAVRGARQTLKVGNTPAEAIEIEVQAGSRAAGRMLRDIRFPAGSILGAIMRAGELIIPTGDATLREGDTAMVFAMPDAVEEALGLFRKRGILG